MGEGKRCLKNPNV